MKYLYRGHMYESILPKPRSFFRGLKNSAPKSQLGYANWDACTFVADNIESAKQYGSDKILKVNAKDTAKILYEGTKEYVKLYSLAKKGKARLIEILDALVGLAKSSGYDAIWFKQQTDLGTAIINKDAFEFNESLNEMAAPLAHHSSLELYHGTDEAHAKQILASGALEGRIVQGRAQQAPVAGYVYTTKDVVYAAGYAGAYSRWGSGSRYAREGALPYTAYVFVVDASKAVDILVDEDVLGEVGTSRHSEDYKNLPEALQKYVVWMADAAGTPNQLRKARDGEMAYQSAIGKKMQKLIPPAKMQELIDHCPHLALKSSEKSIPILGYYTINKPISTKEEFFENAEFHKYQ